MKWAVYSAAVYLSLRVSCKWINAQDCTIAHAIDHREQVRVADSSQAVFCRVASHETREKVVAILDAKATMLDLRVSWGCTSPALSSY